MPYLTPVLLWRLLSGPASGWLLSCGAMLKVLIVFPIVAVLAHDKGTAIAMSQVPAAVVALVIWAAWA